MKFKLMIAFIPTLKNVLYFLYSNSLMSVHMVEKDRLRLKSVIKFASMFYLAYSQILLLRLRAGYAVAVL